MSHEPKEKPQKKPESVRSIAIVALLCGSFLWWWFTMDTTPEDVGPDGLTDRALAEISPPTPRPLVLDFDLLELSMSWLRAGEAERATAVAEKISHPILQARALRAIAQGFLGVLAKDSASMGPALKTVEKISDPLLRQSAHEIILLEIVRMGFPDIAWEQQPSASLQAKLLRVMSETDAQPEAAQRLAKIEPELLTKADPAMLEQLAMTHLWLGHHDRVLEILPKLELKVQDEIYAELFRKVRLEKPADAEAMLHKLPARLHLPCRLEAAKLNGTLETPAQFISELQSLADSAASTPDGTAVARWQFLAKAQWQLVFPDGDTWKQTAEKAEALLSATTGQQRIDGLLTLSQMFYDSLDLINGHRLLESARQFAIKAETPALKLEHVSSVIDAAFRNGEPEYLQLLLIDVIPLLNTPGVLQTVNPKALHEILIASFREGDWKTVIELVETLPEASKARALTKLADLPVEGTAGQGFAISQDRSMHSIRQVATTQGETEAAKLAMLEEAGTKRARAWLEMAKGLILKQVIDAENQAPAAEALPAE